MHSRRSFLARVVAGAGALGVGSTAGCLEGESSDGGAPAYATRLYDPGQVVSASVPTRAFVSYDLATLYERRGLFPDPVTQQIERADQSTEAVSVPDLERATGFGYWGYADPDEPNADDAAGGGSLHVRGSFDPDALLERVREGVGSGATVESAGRVQGLDLYVLQSEREQAGSVALGLSEDSVYAGGTARVDATGEDAARAMITSDDSGYYSRSDTARRLMDALGEGATAVVGGEFDAGQYAPDSFEGVPARENVEAVVRGLTGLGSAMGLGEETVSRNVVGVYEDGETPERSDVIALLDLARQGVATQSGSTDVADVQALIDDTEVSVDGRTVTAEVSRATSDLFDDDGPELGGIPGGVEAAILLAPGLGVYGSFLLGLGPGGPGPGPGDDTRTPPPQVAFDFEYDADAGEVTVTHARGDSLTEENTERLFVRSGERPPVPWELPVAAGDSVTVPAESGDGVFVLWTAPGGDRTQALGRFGVP